MGVTGLWQLLGPVGHPVPLETLENKILAVDVSIWLNQALKGFRDAQGQSLQNAHLLGIFHRVCKLLFYKIKPVFVFDGVAPLLKRQTLAARQERKQKATEDSRDATKKILVNLLNQNLVQQEVTPGTSSTSSTTTKRKHTNSRVAESDLFKLPPLPVENSQSSSEDEDAALGTSFWHEEYQNPSQIDVDSEDFQALPPDLRHEILMNMKEKRKRTWEHISAMPQHSEDFSNYQMTRLLGRRKLQKKIEDVRQEMSAKRAEEFLIDMYEEPQNAEVKKISSDDSSHYVLLTGLKTGTIQKPTDRSADVQTSKTTEAGRTGNAPQEIVVPEVIDVVEEPTATEMAPISRSDLIKCQEISAAWSMHSADAIGSDSLVETESDSSKQVFHTVLEIKDNIDDNRLSGICQQDIYEMVELMESKQKPKMVDLTESEQKLEMVDATKSKQKPEMVDLTEPEEKLEMVDARESKQKPEMVDLTEYEQKLEIVDATGSKHKSGEKLECKNFERENSTENDGPLVGTPSQNQEPAGTSPPMREKSLAKEKCQGNPSPVTPPELVANQNKRKTMEDEPVVLEAPHLQVTVDLSSSAVRDDLFPADIFSTDKQSPVLESEDDQNDVHLIDVETIRNRDKEQLLELDAELREEEDQLLQERGRLERQAATVTDQMYQEAQELLKLFGIPFVVSPAEAEAQCAQLEILGLTQGTITDDSDVWLFGGNVVYKNFFTQGKYIEKYSVKDILAEFGLTRDRMICFAMLTGSDYTEGILNVGHVTAMEILSEFPGEGLDILEEFRNWWDSTRGHERPGGNKTLSKFRKLSLSLGFPSRVVYEAYLHPEVDASEERFSWGLPDLQTIRDFARERFGWTKQKIDGMMLPVMKKVAERQSQMRLDSFLMIGLKKERNLFPSKRLQKAVKKIQSPEKVARTPNLSESSSSEDDPDDPPPTKSTRFQGSKELSRRTEDDSPPKVTRHRIQGAKKKSGRT